MTRIISIAVIALCIGACASSGPGAPVTASTDPAAGSDPLATSNSEAIQGRVIQDEDAPVVEVSAKAAAADDPDEVICRRVVQTGSRMATRICRTRAEIEARAEKDKETMRQSRALQSGGDCALNQNCD